MPRKRSRSAKQKANDRKLGQMAKARARGRRSVSTKRKSPRKTNKPRKRSTRTVAKRKSRSKSSSRGGGMINKIPILKNKTVQKIGFGLGMGSLASLGAGLVPVPIIRQNAALIGTGVAFATDPLSGIVRLALSGGLGQITSLFGGGNGGNGGGGNAGFA